MQNGSCLTFPRLQMIKFVKEINSFVYSIGKVHKCYCRKVANIIRFHFTIITTSCCCWFSFDRLLPRNRILSYLLDFCDKWNIIENVHIEKFYHLNKKLQKIKLPLDTFYIFTICTVEQTNQKQKTSVYLDCYESRRAIALASIWSRSFHFPFIS